MRLFLVRHGRTASNVHRLLDTAVPGADLDAAGRAQAATLPARLDGRELDALFVSDLVRTQQTAAPLAAARGLEPTVLPGLREIAAGDQEMWPRWDAYVAVLSEWARGDMTAARPGGESGEEFFARFDQAVAQIAASGVASAAVVSHGAALKMWVGGRVRGIDPGEVAHRRLGNTAIVEVEGDPESGWRFVAWDEGVELADEGPDVPAPRGEPGGFLLTDAEATAAASAWRLVLGRLRLETVWPDRALAFGFVSRVGELAVALDHDVDVDLRGERVGLALSSADVEGVTHRDTALAGQVAALVDDLGGRCAPLLPATYELGIDTAEAAVIRPFWAAVLGGRATGGDVVDPLGRAPRIWFQDIGTPRPQRNRIHLDVNVPHDAAPARVEAAVAAGGRVLDDASAPAWWVLADADGNEVCISTWQGRDSAAGECRA